MTTFNKVPKNSKFNKYDAEYAKTASEVSDTILPVAMITDDTDLSFALLTFLNEYFIVNQWRSYAANITPRNGEFDLDQIDRFIREKFPSVTVKEYVACERELAFGLVIYTTKNQAQITANMEHFGGVVCTAEQTFKGRKSQNLYVFFPNHVNFLTVMAIFKMRDDTGRPIASYNTKYHPSMFGLCEPK